jgi:hypothetical protein
MPSKIISAGVLCLAVILDVAPAAGQNDGELRQCVADLQVSAWTQHPRCCHARPQQLLNSRAPWSTPPSRT